MTVQLSQRPLNGGHLGEVTQMTGQAEKFGIGELGTGETFFEHFQRPAQMRHDLGNPVITSQFHHLHRQGANVHSHASHRVFFWQHPILTGVGFVSDRATYAYKASPSKADYKKDLLLAVLATLALRPRNLKSAGN